MLDEREENDVTAENVSAEAAETLESPTDVTTKLQQNALKNYIQEWDTYFTTHTTEDELLNQLKSRAFKESLRSCFFRSICWRVFLGCLPAVTEQWEFALQQSRHDYHNIKLKHVTDPHNEAKGRDIQLENPLSQNDCSSWSQYFKNNELKLMIERDVKRTWPEMNFFHSNEIQDLMASVLFCYAREHESLSYRQGMHELLAPLLFVLHCDLQGAAHAKEMGTLPLRREVLSLFTLCPHPRKKYSISSLIINILRESICKIFDEKYLEHDVYSMFCQVMGATNPWYSVNDNSSAEQSSPEAKKAPIFTVPFQPSANNSSSSSLAITNKLNRIHHQLVAEHDVELYQHLNRLEIIPQVYGLRWVRLLFGREFDLQDLLVLWDALFADSRTLDLVDYIFVAMMYNIRLKLLSSDYCQCMQLLMKYPPIEDIYDLVKLALYYRDRKNYEKPASMQRTSGSQVTQISLPNPVKKKILPNFKIDNPFSNLSISLKKSLNIGSPPRTKRNSGSLQPGDMSVQYSSVLQEESAESTKSNPTSKMERLRSLSGLDSMKTKKTEEELRQNELEILKKKLHDLQQKCVFCSELTDASIKLLQPFLMKNGEETSNETLVDGDYNLATLKNEDQLVAIAKLKKVRDLLRGSLSFVEKSRTCSKDGAVAGDARSVANDWTVVDKPHVHQ